MSAAAFLIQDIAAAQGLGLREDHALDLVSMFAERGARDAAAVDRRPGCHPSTVAASVLAPGLSNLHTWAKAPEEWTWADVKAAPTLDDLIAEAERSSVVATGRAGGGCVEFKGRRRTKALVKHERGEVKEFTAASRLRLLKLVNGFDREIVASSRCAFVTTTYPATYPALKAVWKNQLHNLRRRITATYGRCGIVWKLEPQRRGAPHFHLLVFFPQGFNLVELRRNVARWWAKIVDHVEREKHEAAGTSVEVVQSFGGVASYAAKYVGKDDGGKVFTSTRGELVPPGRFWGVYHRDLMEGDKRVESSDECSMDRVRRCMRKYLEKSGAKIKNKAGWLGVAGSSYTAFLPERDVQRLFDAYLPWRRFNLTFQQWRSFEIAARRALHVRRLEAECLPTDEGPPSVMVDDGLWN